jgi:phosphatidate cytidylyltransferase
MIRIRLLSALVLVPVVLVLTYLGGLWFLGLVLLVLTLAGREYANLLKHQGGGPSATLVIATIWVLVLDAHLFDGRLLRPGLSVCVLGSLVWAIVRYERGHASAVSDWAWTLAGGLYVGWTGAHFILLRDLNTPLRINAFTPAHGGGLSWAILALAVGWLADTGAYFVGRAWGRHKFAPLVSPFKTWEGYAGGVVIAAVSGIVFVALIRILAPMLGESTGLTLWDGWWLGLLVSIFSPLGDLAESMIKRHAGAKDSGRLIPGHGGMFDRIDSLLWAAVIAFYYATWVGR